MLIGFDKKRFGEFLRETRVSRELTQKQVYEMTNVSTETLRRMENGYTVPQLRTMEDLSHAYQVDILKAFMMLRRSNNYYLFYQLLDELIIDNSELKLEVIKEKYEEMISNDHTEIFDFNEKVQFRHILDGLGYMYRGVEFYDEAADCYKESIRICNPDFSLDRIEDYNYTYLDYKCLLLLSKIHGEKKENVKSNKILLYLNEQILFTSDNYKYFEEVKKIHIKILFNIAYNFHCLDMYDKVVKYAKNGIAKCVQMKTLYYLHALYYRLGIAYYLLGEPRDKYFPFLNKSMMLLEVENRRNLIELYRDKTYEIHKIRI